jgi:predicted NUDIX family phosphoesterase
MASDSVEHVLVVPTSVFHEVGHFQGFHHDAEKYLSALLRPEWMSYRPRNEMEQDPSFKQLIPYVLFRHRAREGANRSVCLLPRKWSRAKSRLHRKRSVGIGGHISSEDVLTDNLTDVYREGLRRELAEEVQIATEYTEACVGIINDDQTDVGRVHLGIVHLFDVLAPHVVAREDDIADGRFVSIDELLAQRDQFETWSQICLDALFGGERSDSAAISGG